MTRVSTESRFDIVKSFEELVNAQKDSRLLLQAAEQNYATSTSEAICTTSGSNSAPQSRQSGCSFLSEKIDIPELLVHKLHDATVFPGKIRARQGNWHSHGQLVTTSHSSLFQESYGIMDGGHTLPRDLLIESDDSSGYTLQQPKPEKFLQGCYLFLGSMHDHFGHFLVEGLARLWILKYFNAAELSALKIIIYEPGIIPPATKILEYLGVKKSQIQFLSEPCRVESLIAPSIAYRTHFWAREIMNFVYNTIASSATSERVTDFPRKVFLSRNNVQSRKLQNEIALESIYRDAGYWVIRPEELPIGDQIRIAANADSIAGCTGSNMYLAMFQKPGGVNHIYAPYNFTLKDDALISQMRKSKLLYILGSSLEQDQWKVDMTAAENILKDLAKND